MDQRKGLLRRQVVQIASCTLGCKRNLSFVSFVVPTIDDPSRSQLLVFSLSPFVSFLHAIDISGPGNR
jgi:hypothetical protein